MQLISTVTLSAAAASITLSAIPQDADDLYIITSLRNTTNTTNSDRLLMTFNAASVNPSMRIGSRDFAVFEGNNESGGMVGFINLSTTTANTFANGRFYVSGYTLASNKQVHGETVREANTSSADLHLQNGHMATTSAITSISFEPQAGTLAAGSSVSIYKIKRS
jgi:hypothetical protein